MYQYYSRGEDLLRRSKSTQGLRNLRYKHKQQVTKSFYYYYCSIYMHAVVVQISFVMGLKKPKCSRLYVYSPLHCNGTFPSCPWQTSKGGKRYVFGRFPHFHG